MAFLRTERTAIRSLGTMISPLVDSLSIGRARIVIEQIRRNVPEERLIILRTSRRDETQGGRTEVPLAACVAMLQPAAPHNPVTSNPVTSNPASGNPANGNPANGNPAPGNPESALGRQSDPTGDVATILHAGALCELSPTLQEPVMASLAEALDCQLRQHGVSFVQWASDEVVDHHPSPPTSPTAADWCRSFGFQPIGTLEYLSASVPEDPDEPFERRPDSPLRFRVLDWSDPNAWEQWTRLVDSTYTETLDCPDLSRYRTTEQTLGGYQTTDAFDPELWLIASDAEQNDVGCAILATHQQVDETKSNPSQRIDSVEIVYMGLSNRSRGNSYGQQLVRKSFDVARELGAHQVLLAVDQRNEPAKAIYWRAGLRPIIKETIWVKSLDAEGNGSSQS